MRIQLQTEASECGLACLAMISSNFGYQVSLAELRHRFVVSLKGITLFTLVRYAATMGLASRPLRLEIEELQELAQPCILHWDLDHFVILKKVTGKIGNNAKVTIIDPAVGERTLSLQEVSKHFTGVAVEFTPTEKFEKKSKIDRVGLRELTGKIHGLRRALFQVFILAFALETLAISLPLFNQFVVDEVILSADLDLLKILVVGFSILIVTQTCIGLARGWILMRWSMEVSMQWSTRLFQHLIHLPVNYFEKRHIGDIVSRFGSMRVIQSTLTSVLVGSFLDGIMAVMALVMMWIYSVQLTLTVLGSIAAYALLRWAYYKPLRDASAERIVLAAKEATHFLETLRAITPIKLHGYEDQRRYRWQNLLMDVQNRDVKTEKLSLTARVANSTIFAAQGLITFYLGAKLVMSGNLTLGMLMAFTSYSATFTGRVFSLIDVYVGYQMLEIHKERLADIVHEKREEAEEIWGDLPYFRESLELRNVSFRYADGEPWVLKEINLIIKPGELVALTGPSGCGKTTLCKILLGLIKPNEGDILVDGIPIQQIGVSRYRRIVGTVMQDDALLAGSILDNISFFADTACLEKIMAASMQASIHDDIIAMPMGYQTLIGDMGGSLSGGQRQRLLLARAFYREPKLLCLDEATSNLDVTNEEKILSSLQNQECTCIMVAHRPEAILRASRVVKMESGVIVLPPEVHEHDEVLC